MATVAGKPLTPTNGTLERKLPVVQDSPTLDEHLLEQILGMSQWTPDLSLVT